MCIAIPYQRYRSPLLMTYMKDVPHLAPRLTAQPPGVAKMNLRRAAAGVLAESSLCALCVLTGYQLGHKHTTDMHHVATSNQHYVKPGNTSAAPANTAAAPVSAGAPLAESPMHESKTSCPRIVHLMYFPWGTNHKMKGDPEDFDKTWLRSFRAEAAQVGWKVKMWTLPKIREFQSSLYPKYSTIFDVVSHPVQLVDFFRLLVVYHFGGVHWQYHSKKKTHLDELLPTTGTARLLIETIISPEFGQKMANEPIRNGVPEEHIRVATQCFVAVPRHPFLMSAINMSWCNLHKYTVNTDYDILFVGGNAMMSTAYDVYPNKDDLQLTENKFVDFSSDGSWRQNSNTSVGEVKTSNR